MGMMGGYGFGNYGLMSGYIGTIFNLALMIGFVFFVVWAVRQFLRGNAGKSFNDVQPYHLQKSAHDILAERYARGEITSDEYHAVLNDIA